MATELQFRRGTTTEHDSFTGAQSEVTHDTERNTLIVHDGSTQGGHPLAAGYELNNLSETSSLRNTVNRLAYLSQQGGMAVDYTVLANEFIKAEGLPSDVDPELAVAIGMNAFGYPVAGGYYDGLIDTIAGTIDSQDDYQTGLRYALIVAPKSLEGGRGASPASGLPTGDLEWDTQDRGGEAGCFTRWNGLEATNVIIAKDEAAYEAHNFIADVRSQYPAVSTPGGTEWYLPAMDELELLYRNFKPNNADNDTRDFPRNFPGSNPSGRNLSSVPEGFNYENSPRIPDVTYLDLFKEGNAQAIDLDRYWSTTDADQLDFAWVQYFTNPGTEAIQTASGKDRTILSVRPVRRIVLS